MQVGGEKHDYDGNDTKDDDTILYFFVLSLQAVLGEPQSVHISPDHFQRVFNLLRLQFDTA